MHYTNKRKKLKPCKREDALLQTINCMVKLQIDGGVSTNTSKLQLKKIVKLQNKNADFKCYEQWYWVFY